MDQRQRRNANGWRLGVDVGGTKIATLLVDGDNRVWASVQRPTDTATPDHALQSLADAIWETLKQADLPIRLLAGIGIGIPGQVDTQSGIVRHAVNLGWQAVDLRGFINATFGTACVIENDVRAAALGIQRYWLAGSIDSILYVSIGTGIAAGMILDGAVYRGSHGMAGEIGHARFGSSTIRCRCGNYGCLEAIVAGPAIANYAHSLLSSFPHSQLHQLDLVTTPAVYAAAEAGDDLALAVAHMVGEQLAQALYTMVLAYDCDHIVLGGGVSRAGSAFFTPIEQALDILRQQSSLAASLLPTGRVKLLDRDFAAGAWGGIALLDSQALARVAQTQLA